MIYRFLLFTALGNWIHNNVLNNAMRLAVIKHVEENLVGINNLPKAQKDRGADGFIITIPNSAYTAEAISALQAETKKKGWKVSFVSESYRTSWGNHDMSREIRLIKA